MKNLNKCFFSISLENGITITGKNPEEVKEFLYDMHSAFFELFEHYQKNELKYLEKKAVNTMEQIKSAINTIIINNNKERTKQ